MEQLKIFIAAKKKIESNYSLTDKEREALLFVLNNSESIPSEREYLNYIEAKEILEQFQNREVQQSLYSFFEPKVKQFESKYKNILGVA